MRAPGLPLLRHPREEAPEHRRPVVARFDQAHASTDGGAVLLTAFDAQLGLTTQLAACLSDRRDPDKIRHTVRELLQQRVFGLACGYEDANDAARLAHDPLHKLAVGRDPLTGVALASQPTLSRFEHAVGPRALYRMGRTLAATVIAQHRHRLKGRARRITIDLDPTDDPTHGQQALAFFNGHDDTWCSRPLVATLTFNDEPEQYLVAVVLRPGNSPAKRGAFGLLRTLLRQLRQAFPGTPLRVRVDGGFAGNDWLDVLEVERVEYVVGLANNPRLEQRAGRVLGEAYGLSKYSGRTEHVYGETRYAAQSWSHRRRGIIKAEVVRLPGREPTCNPRVVVTNLREAPAAVYAVYCQRGDRENRLKELHHRLALDRTSGSQCWANQFRVLLTAAAYVLLQALRHLAHGTDCARAQVSTLRERLLKMAVWVALGAPHRVAFAPHSPLGHDLAPGGRRSRRGIRLTSHLGSYRTVAQRDSTGDVCRESPAQVHATTTCQLPTWKGRRPPQFATATGAQESQADPEWRLLIHGPSLMNNAG
ncbi:MAG: IS1380 family transposase [Nitrospira sp.]|nr:IS1380 family transposase [Nitrospira sp.]